MSPAEPRRLVIAALVLLALPVTWSGTARVLAAGAAPEPLLERPISGECVRDPAWMRGHHMELLLATRDEVVREGHRGDVTWAGCAACHPDRGRFCDRCHEEVNLAPDCFTCHAWPAPGGTP